MLYSFDGRAPEIGQETYVSENALVIGDVKVGNNCYIGHGAILRGDYGSILIGDGSAVEEGVIIHAPPQEECQVGERVTFGHGAVVHAKSIGEFAVIGMGAVLSLWVEAGAHSIVGEGAVVKRKQKVHGRVVVAGNPARVVREISSADEEFWSRGKQTYIDLARKYLNIGMRRLD